MLIVARALASPVMLPAVAGHRASLKGVRVVVVDDHGDSVAIFLEPLEVCGAFVRAASSAEQAVALLTEVDVVVTSLIMPDKDGIWLLEQVRRLAGRVRVLAVSGNTPLENDRLARATFDRILLKPVDPFRLCDEVEAVLRR